MPQKTALFFNGRSSVDQETLEKILQLGREGVTYAHACERGYILCAIELDQGEVDELSSYFTNFKEGERYKTEEGNELQITWL